MALTADDVNYLIFRYLQEGGFVHSAYAFSTESAVKKLDLDHDEFQPGILIKLIQKGLQYMELEANLHEDGTTTDDDFQVLTAADILRSKDAAELRSLARQQRDEREETPEAMDEDTLVSSNRCISLKGHQGEVFAIGWNPDCTCLATSGSDATGRVWEVETAGSSFSQPLVHVLKHNQDDFEKDVSTLDWSPNGQYVATGAYDGTRIWTRSGQLHRELKGHDQAVYCIKFSPDGCMLLTGSVDQTAAVWNVETGDLIHKVDSHAGEVLDVAWRDNNTFGTCSADGCARLFKLTRAAQGRPAACEVIRALRGHRHEVNCLQWSPNGKLLATCSDDHTTKLWTTLEDEPLCTLVDTDLEKDPNQLEARSHKQEVYICRFRPAGPGSANPNLALQLATASFDTTVKIWDCESAALLHKLERHSKALYTMEYSPDGKMLASGALDDRVIIWDVTSGSVVKTFQTDGGPFDLSWHKDCRRLAVATSNKVVHVLDMKL